MLEDVLTLDNEATGDMLSIELVVVGVAVVVMRDVADEDAERENDGVPVSVVCKLPDVVDVRVNVNEENELPDAFEVKDIDTVMRGEAL